MVRLCKAEQPLNAKQPIFCTEFPSVTLFRDLQPPNASMPISSTESGMVKLYRAVLENAL